MTSPATRSMRGEPVVMLATSIHLPTAEPSGVLVVCSPGGTFPRSTFDLRVPGRRGYSFARFMAACGHTVAAVDLLGTGDSPHDGDDVTMATAADALADTVGELRRVTGPALRWTVGLGHSLGAAVTVRAEADFAVFDGVAALGYTPRWCSVPFTDERPSADDPGALRAWTHEQLARAAPQLWSRPLVRFPRRSPEPFSYRADVPADVVAAVSADPQPVPRGLAVDFGIPEPALAAAARVRCPVLLAFGDPDVATASAGEPACYPASPALATYQVHDSGHCHHVSTGRGALWRRLDAWIHAICQGPTLASTEEP